MIIYLVITLIEERQMTVTKTYEPIRPLRAPDDGSAYYQQDVNGTHCVHYGESYWPSRSFLIIKHREAE